uniref:(northern house mosquito) hypothetical protein n=1 Tax=Culex pipiens TaxID=7175 RepID=A0A8D8G317_CULPI
MMMCEKTNFHHPPPPYKTRNKFLPPSGCPFAGVASPKSVIRWGGQPGKIDPKGRRWPRTPPLQSASRPPRQREREHQKVLTFLHTLTLIHLQVRASPRFGMGSSKLVEQSWLPRENGLLA